MNEKEIRDTLENVIQLILKKNEDYGSASFDLGLNGNMVHIYDKANRYKTLIEKMNKGESPNFESVDDTLKDIIGYAVIGLLMLKKQNQI